VTVVPQRDVPTCYLSEVEGPASLRHWPLEQHHPAAAPKPQLESRCISKTAVLWNTPKNRVPRSPCFSWAVLNSGSPHCTSPQLDGVVARAVLPSSRLGKALNYLRNRWAALNVYIQDGRLPIDNNWVERLMKRIAVGKKTTIRLITGFEGSAVPSPSARVVVFFRPTLSHDVVALL